MFDVNATVFAPNSTVTINLDGATSVIINVALDGCAPNNCAFALPDSVKFSDPSGYASHVLWNFANATGLTFASASLEWA